MIALIQRVSESRVEVDGKVVGQIGKGLNILLGVAQDDKEEDIKKLVDKVLTLRIFEDENRKMNLSLLDVSGEVLVISQFTLVSNLKKGRRPSFETAAKPDVAKRLYEEFVRQISNHVKTQTGVFGADMKVFIVNDGPVTFILNSKDL